MLNKAMLRGISLYINKMQNKNVKMSKDNKISFLDYNHTYTHVESGKIYPSTTSIIKKFKQPFDENTIANAYAKKNNMDVSSVKALWKETRDTACKKGIYIHKLLEDLAKGVPHECKNIYPEEIYATNFYKDFVESGNWSPVALEEVLWSKVGLAGQVDAIFSNKEGELSLVDYKTSKNINKTNAFNKKMLHDFSHLDDCEYNHYSLQLSIYKMMYPDPIKNLIIVHIKPDGYSIEHAVDLNCTEEQVEKWLKY